MSENEAEIFNRYDLEAHNKQGEVKEFETYFENPPDSSCQPSVASPMAKTSEILKVLKSVPVTSEMVETLQPILHIDEVYPGLYIGNEQAALDKIFLKNVGITHVLNVAQGKGSDLVDTNECYYEDTDIIFLGVKLVDSPCARITQFFALTTKFIDYALSIGGKVMIHSVHGVSRSPTFACSYIMARESWPALVSLIHISRIRAILPNRGFVNQLLEFEWRKSSLLQDLVNISITRDETCQENHRKGIDEMKYPEESFLRPYITTQLREAEEGWVHSASEFEESLGNENIRKDDFKRKTEDDEGIEYKRKIFVKDMMVNKVSGEIVGTCSPSIDEIYPSLYNGDQNAALDLAFLREVGITHVMNVAQGKGPDFVDTDERYYLKDNIQFMGIRLADSPRVRIVQFFQQSNDFIEEALGVGGKVLIHSVNGTSRSATFACCYIMAKEGWPTLDSLIHICKIRPVMPNRGFITQLLELEWRRTSILKEIVNDKTQCDRESLEKYERDFLLYKISTPGLSVSEVDKDYEIFGNSDLGKEYEKMKSEVIFQEKMCHDNSPLITASPVVTTREILYTIKNLKVT